MTRKIRFILFLLLSMLCFLLAVGLTITQMNRFTQERADFPPGAMIAGASVGGQTPAQAAQRVEQIYAQTPVELRMANSRVQVLPAQLQAAPNLQTMLAAADIYQQRRPFWPAFWAFLWNRPPASFAIPADCTVDTSASRAALEKLFDNRYGQPALAARPIPADVLMLPGQPGQSLNLDGVEEKIRAAVCSPSQRVIEISTKNSDALPPTITSLDAMLQAITQGFAFDGLIEVYFQDLRSGQDFNFAWDVGKPVKPGIAFTGASTIKIPVMISAYQRARLPLSAELQKQMGLMIDLSDNGSTDEVMQSVLDPNIAPVQVTQDMRALGLENTFLAGFFYPGAPLLDRYSTPANLRADISTDPDVYNQTTPADMGHLLADIYHCATDGSGALTQTFPATIDSAKCQEMIAFLAKNRKGLLLESGLPEGTPLAHKYGWVTDSQDGLMHTASDAAILYTPGGDCVLTVFLYHPQQLQWEESQRLVARLATAVYNFYNHWKG